MILFLKYILFDGGIAEKSPETVRFRGFFALLSVIFGEWWKLPNFTGQTGVESVAIKNMSRSCSSCFCFIYNDTLIRKGRAGERTIRHQHRFVKSASRILQFLLNYVVLKVFLALKINLAVRATENGKCAVFLLRFCFEWKESGDQLNNLQLHWNNSQYLLVSENQVLCYLEYSFQA